MDSHCISSHSQRGCRRAAIKWCLATRASISFPLFLVAWPNYCSLSRGSLSFVTQELIRMLLVESLSKGGLDSIGSAPLHLLLLSPFMESGCYLQQSSSTLE